MSWGTPVMAIPAADCNDRPVNGLSSNQACCQCNGGEKSATPFTYPDTPLLQLEAAVSLKPLPRTAERYSVDSGCGFAAHNLTIDGATGAITSTQNPTKPFTVQCEVSAHQALHLVSTVKVSVTVEFMSYWRRCFDFLFRCHIVSSCTGFSCGRLD